MSTIEIKGQKIYYESVSTSHKMECGESQTILFLHGAGGSSQHWQKQLRFSFGAGYQAMALDLPGHGRSEGTLIGTISDYADFVLAFLQGMGLSQVILAGHSMGGGIALEFALKYPQYLRAIILIGTGARLRVNQEILNLLGRGEHPLAFVKYLYSPHIGEEVVQQAIAEMKGISPQIYLSGFLACDGFNRVEEVKRISLPTLVLCGDEDQMTPLKYAQYLQQAIPEAQLISVPETGHMMMLERPQPLNRAIKHFIEGLNH